MFVTDWNGTVKINKCQFWLNSLFQINLTDLRSCSNSSLTPGRSLAAPKYLERKAWRGFWIIGKFFKYLRPLRTQLACTIVPSQRINLQTLFSSFYTLTWNGLDTLSLSVSLSINFNLVCDFLSKQRTVFIFHQHIPWPQHFQYTFKNAARTYL